MKRLFLSLLFIFLLTINAYSIGPLAITSPTPTGGDTTPPTLTSSTIPAAGTSISLLFNKAVRVGAGGNAGWTITMSGGASAMSYSSGSGSTTLVYTLARTILSNETGTIAYTQPGNGIEGNVADYPDLATIASAAVTNSSTYPGAAGSYMNEYFEAAGYDCGAGVPTGSAAWAPEVGAGCTVDPDTLSSAAGSPAGWGTYCLKTIKAAVSADAYTEKDSLAMTSAWMRVEVVIPDVTKITAGETQTVLRVYDETDGKVLFITNLYRNGAGTKTWFETVVKLDGSADTDCMADDIDLVNNTLYRLEYKWDIVNHKFSWKINGTAEDTDLVLAAGHATHLTLVRLGLRSFDSAVAFTTYYDKVSLDSTTWIGP